MAEDSKPKVDVIVLVLVLGVMVGGFMMVGKTVDDKAEGLEIRMSHVMDSVKGVALQVAELQHTVNTAHKAAAAAVAEPAPVAAVPAKK